MFCRKCGTKNADGAKFCINCGAELASPQPTAQPATSVKKSKAPLVIGGVVAVLAVLAVVGFVVMPMLNRGPWTGTMMLDGVSANYDHEFGIKTDGKTVTVYDQDDVVTGTIAGTREEGDRVFYDVKDVSWGGWGGSSFSASSVTDKVMTIIVPKGASATKPFGRWSVVVSATDTDDEYPLYVRSTTLELDEDGTGYYEFASEWGKESDVAVADPTNSAYDPAGSGWKHPLTSSGSNGSYDVEFNDDTYNLTFTDGK